MRNKHHTCKNYALNAHNENTFWCTWRHQTCSTLSVFPCYAVRSLGNSIKPAKIITVKLVILFSNTLVGIMC